MPCTSYFPSARTCASTHAMHGVISVSQSQSVVFRFPLATPVQSGQCPWGNISLHIHVSALLGSSPVFLGILSLQFKKLPTEAKEKHQTQNAVKSRIGSKGAQNKETRGQRKPGCKACMSSSSELLRNTQKALPPVDPGMTHHTLSSLCSKVGQNQNFTGLRSWAPPDFHPLQPVAGNKDSGGSLSLLVATPVWEMSKTAIIWSACNT